MAKLATLIGTLLMAVGLYFFMQSKATTALIPVFFGFPIQILGALAVVKPHLRKHFMHGVALLALLGTAGGLGMGLPKAIKWIGGAAPERPNAVILQVIMGVLCLILLVACIRSFINARKQKSYAAE